MREVKYCSMERQVLQAITRSASKKESFLLMRSCLWVSSDEINVRQADQERLLNHSLLSSMSKCIIIVSVPTKHMSLLSKSIQ